MGGIGVRRGGRSPGWTAPSARSAARASPSSMSTGRLSAPEVHEISSSAAPCRGPRLARAEPHRYRLPSWMRPGPALKNVTTPVVADPRARAGMRISVVMIRYRETSKKGIPQNGRTWPPASGTSGSTSPSTTSSPSSPLALKPHLPHREQARLAAAATPPGPGWWGVELEAHQPGQTSGRSGRT